MDDEDDLESLLEMPLELPQKAERRPKPMQWPLLPERGTTRADMRPLAPLTRFADDRAWAHRTLSCSVTKGILEIEENGHRLSNIELFWSRVSSGKPSSSTREAYHLDMNEMVLLVRPSVRCRQFQTQEQWSFACRRSWLPYILHHLATEGAVLEKEVELCFNLEGRCGKGGYGTIRRGCPVVSEYYSPCQVAIKVAAERDVRHELRMLVSAGRHPSVIQQHGAFRGSDQGRGPWSLILEFYPEGDLWHFCADRLPLPQALSLLHNLLLGLQHIHSRKIFHRDVKPENILVSCERAVLCDFGVAELLELRTLQRARGLTPQYASPEMVTSNSMDPRGDVYAAGATFHFMITLQYVSTSIKKKWSRWWSKPESELCFEKPPLAQLPVCCQDLLLQMICPERKRLTAKEAVRHYAFWSLADPEDYGEASSHAHSYLFPAGDLSQTPSDVAPLSIFGTESVSAWRERVVAPGANGASGTSSEASSRRSGRRSSHTSASTDSGWQNNACQQVIEEQISVDESMEILKQKLRFPPEQSSSWGRETKKPRPPGVKAPRARRTSVSHWIGQHMQALAEHLPRRPSNLSKVEPEPAELPVIPAELQREAQHPF